jgi:hypothetical protein
MENKRYFRNCPNSECTSVIGYIAKNDMLKAENKQTLCNLCRFLTKNNKILIPYDFQYK